MGQIEPNAQSSSAPATGVRTPKNNTCERDLGDQLAKCGNCNSVLGVMCILALIFLSLQVLPRPEVEQQQPPCQVAEYADRSRECVPAPPGGEVVVHRDRKSVV